MRRRSILVAVVMALFCCHVVMAVEVPSIVCARDHVRSKDLASLRTEKAILQALDDLDPALTVRCAGIARQIEVADGCVIVAGGSGNGVDWGVCLLGAVVLLVMIAVTS